MSRATDCLFPAVPAPVAAAKGAIKSANLASTQRILSVEEHSCKKNSKYSEVVEPHENERCCECASEFSKSCRWESDEKEGGIFFKEHTARRRTHAKAKK